MLTSPIINYKDVILEAKIGDTDCDVYVPSENLIIEIDGPCHYYSKPDSNGKLIMRPSLSYRKNLKLNKRIIRVKPEHFADFQASCQETIK